MTSSELGLTEIPREAEEELDRLTRGGEMSLQKLLM